MRDPAKIKDELLRRASNLERYPFLSATLAEGAKFPAFEMRKLAMEIHTEKEPTEQPTQPER